jgi:hypothetical protein
VMEQLGVDPSLPRAALNHEGPTQPDGGPQVTEVIGRDPALRKIAGEKQVPEQACIGTVSLRPSLRAPTGACLSRLGEMHLHAGTAQLLDEKAPTGCGLEGERASLPPETCDKGTHLITSGGCDLTAALLAGAQIDPVIGDLRAMDILLRSSSGPPLAPLRCSGAYFQVRTGVPERRGSPLHAICNREGG